MLKIKLIIKIMNGKAISIILEDGQIPSDFLSNLYPDIDKTIDGIAEKFNIHNAYVQPKLVTLLTENDTVFAYYTILAPMEFLDEKTISKLANNFSQLSEQDRIAIRQAISLFPY